MLSEALLQKYNIKVTTLGESIASRMSQDAPRDSGELASKIKLKTRSSFGQINRLTISFSRHGIFREQGTGRGVKIDQVDSSNRKAHLFIDKNVEWGATELQDIVAEFYLDETIRATSIGR